MACDHKGGPELIEMAEADLHARNVPQSDWAGLRFRWAENLEGGMWSAAIVEIERRGENWIVTRIDRRREPLPEEETGYRQIA